MKIGLKLTKQSKVALFGNIFSKIAMSPDFNLPVKWYNIFSKGWQMLLVDELGIALEGGY